MVDFEVRYDNKHLSFIHGLCIYSCRTAIGEGVEIVRTGSVERGINKVTFVEESITVESFDREYYHAFRALPEYSLKKLYKTLKEYFEHG